MKKLLISLFAISFSCSAMSYEIKRVEPSTWWTGMESSQLQLMVYGENIAELRPHIEAKGISVEQLHLQQNSNYLFIDLVIADTAKAGEFVIQFKDNKGKTQLNYNYPLQTRQSGSAAREGFSAKDTIYLVTPDRFANGDTTNDEVKGLIEGLDRSDPYGRHGGDIQGLINHLDYIKDMGFTQLWLNPVLENNGKDQSYHGYAATDFYNVDARYGSNELYKELADKARQQGIGLIIDVVLNHGGSNHWWMQDLPSDNWNNFNNQFVPTHHKREALHDPHATKFDAQRHADGWFVETMPDLNQKNPLMANYLIQNSIWWVEYLGLSGIRVDTYSYPDKAFLSEWTRRLTEEYPKLNITGEEWSENPAIVSYWQKGSHTHDGYKSYIPSMIDFPLQLAVVNALNKKETWGTGLVEIYKTLANDFMYGNPYELVTFPDNHDMSRIFTQLNEDINSFNMAMTIFATTRGIPQFFYGSEILMSNPGTESHGVIRSDFPGGWKGDKINAFTGKGLTKQQKNAQNFVRKLLNWRKTASAIHDGKLQHYAPFDNLYVYSRYNENQRIMVVINKSDDESKLEPARVKEITEGYSVATNVLNNNKSSLKQSLSIPARSAIILELK